MGGATQEEAISVRTSIGKGGTVPGLFCDLRMLLNEHTSVPEYIAETKDQAISHLIGELKL